MAEVGLLLYEGHCYSQKPHNSGSNCMLAVINLHTVFVLTLSARIYGRRQELTSNYLRNITVNPSDVNYGLVASVTDDENPFDSLPIHNTETGTDVFRILKSIGNTGRIIIQEGVAQLIDWATGLALSQSTSTLNIQQRSPPNSLYHETASESLKLTDDTTKPRSATGKAKRARSLEGSLSDHNGDGDGDGAKSNSKRRREAEVLRLNFACPFAKKDPVRWRPCYKPQLKKISYVKQHLYRTHLQPLFCTRCGMVFNNQEALSQHLRSTRVCEVREITEPEGLTIAQRQQLSQRASSKLSEEEQWFVVFEIVFPGHPRPSTPYVDPDMSEDLSSFRDYISTEGPGILVEQLQNSEPSLTEGASNSFMESIIRQGIGEILSRWFLTRSLPVNQPSSPQHHLTGTTSTSNIHIDTSTGSPTITTVGEQNVTGGDSDMITLRTRNTPEESRGVESRGHPLNSVDKISNQALGKP